MHPSLLFKLKSQTALRNKKGHKAKSLCGPSFIQKLLKLRRYHAIELQKLSTAGVYKKQLGTASWYNAQYFREGG
jgi:hypothetical protein